ncbi:aminoglycoside phosphotransferase family protein [Streptomyces griseocarneus]|uniref:aminoglycoside phosphotransferase family protein n=1 Tax=Streptomyces griseocarneus TaxID=51201 RepID=UPI00167DB3BE|nr:aminoglycoside phosphotransferase family protein [Streptomyces griseocarneus]MBZ6478047.1 aminoglycoside phosphotransferase family protein [Streptomyces griseocarneus]GHG55176.1 kinase [Streptomyces griseocarneus]
MATAHDSLEPPQRLVRTLGADPAYGDAANRWLAALPGLARECLERWDLTPERVQTPGGRTSMVVLARRSDGTPVALKLCLPDGSAALEHAALAHWDGRSAVRALDVAPEAGALLLERLHADVSLRSLAEAKAQLEAAATLQRLWVAPPAGHSFPDVAGHTAALADALRAHREQPWAADARAVLDEALELRDALVAEPPAGEGAVLLHGEYHQGNVLAADRLPWLAIAPRPLVGERAYDLAWLVRDRLDTLLAAPGAAAAVRRRVAKLAESLDVDPGRLRGWTLFRTAREGAHQLALGARGQGELLLEFAGLL